jgi:D-beta-D-heptose 7-phosphate kinase/D-beta-D-heptose 1-phosphate adenosyltransferase
VVWDPHPRGLAPVSAVRMVTPNSREAAALAGSPAGQGLLADITSARTLLARWDVKQVAVTRGALGAVLVQDTHGVPLVVNAPAAWPSDSCGAGDLFAVAVTMMLANGALPSEAVTAAVAMASAYVAAGGPAALAGNPPGLRDTASGRPDPLAVAQRVRAAGGTIVAAGGCFDLLHTGHVRMLAEARRLGDCLIVCLNSDDSVAQLKGPSRPVIPAPDREAMLLALRSVDAVLTFDERTPEQALRLLRPHIFVKGGDYTIADLPEAAVLGEWDGQVVVVPYVAGRSTTSLIQTLAR